MSKRKGFTLIELLVVISIIALLIAILLPALASARRATMAVQCLTNLRQLGVGLANYSSDFKEIYPQGFDTFGSSGDQTHQWGYKLWNYVGYQQSSFQWPTNDLQHDVQTYPNQVDNNIFHCQATKRGGTAVPVPFGGASVKSGRFSYGLNFTPGSVSVMQRGIGWSAGMVWPTFLYEIDSPSSGAIILEASDKTTSQEHFFTANGLLPHPGGVCNVLFFDGHATAMRIENIPATQAWSSSTNYDVFWDGRR